MLGDIQIYDDGVSNLGATDNYVVASGTAAAKIKAGEPVYIAANGAGVATALATNLPSSANSASTISGVAAIRNPREHGEELLQLSGATIYNPKSAIHVSKNRT